MLILSISFPDLVVTPGRCPGLVSIWVCEKPMWQENWHRCATWQNIWKFTKQGSIFSIFAVLIFAPCLLSRDKGNETGPNRGRFSVFLQFRFLLFVLYLVTKGMKLDKTKCWFVPMSRRNFLVLWPNLVQCADRAYTLIKIQWFFICIEV